MPEMSCDSCQPLIPEVALGVVHGRERAEVLAHIEHCPSCQHELLLMGDLADRLVELTPSAEPPPGFETRVLSALAEQAFELGASPAHTGEPATSASNLGLPGVPSVGAAHPAGARDRGDGPVGAVGDGAGGGRSSGRLGSIRGAGAARSGRKQRPAVLALAAACLAVVVGVTSWTIGHHDASEPGRSVSSVGHATVANLVADHRTVGQVVVAGGGEPWVAMAMNTTLGNQEVACRLREQDGKAVTLGWFKLENGYGYWAAPIPVTTSPVVAAELVGAHGATLAMARLTVSAFGS